MIEHRSYLLKLAQYYTHDRSRAEDLVQDTFVRALRFQHKFDGKSPKAWLSTILARLFYSKYRKYKLERAYLERMKYAAEEDRETAEQSVDLDEAGFKETISDEALKALNSLKEEYRRIIVLSDLNGMSHKELSKEIGIPVGTVMSRLFRARENFRKVYKTPMGAPADRPEVG